VPILDPATTLEAAAAVLRRDGWEALPVVREGRLFGVVLADDVGAARPSAATTLAIAEIRGALARVRVDRVMRADLPRVAPSTPVAEAARLLRDGAPALAVLDGGRVAGVLGVADLLAVLERWGTSGGGAELHAVVINR
jgi:CBS domain-containing protein